MVIVVGVIVVVVGDVVVLIISCFFNSGLDYLNKGYLEIVMCFFFGKN